MRSRPGIWVISSGRPRAPVRMVTMRKAAENEERITHAAEAGRAGRELDHVRAERAELGRA